MSKNAEVGFIRADEAYAKQELMQRLGISQKFWDKMLSEGLPAAQVRHAKWVTGQSVIDYINQPQKQKSKIEPAFYCSVRFIHWSDLARPGRFFFICQSTKG